MGDEALRMVEDVYEVLGSDDVVAALADDDVNRRMRETLDRVATADFEVRMRAPGHLGTTELRGRGADGFRSIWEDWTGPFERFHIELERRFQRGDQIVDLVRLSARTRTGGVAMEQDGGAVWTLREGKLARAEFFLQRGEALQAAGIDPDRPGS
jgi:ketosteroid isomerase-like protein